ncbi:hypothetical protein AK830_g6943 [Neonectria ditissima]|uniref:Dynamin N-terminal domain-containing protein n=1 Tax=Neonectria ditissima TaxID=78410 RepID=A0A0P7BF74_9HYPO|nr:hypothetical protein AK830_g6943 [Neonectria ditissima]
MDLSVQPPAKRQKTSDFPGPQLLEISPTLSKAQTNQFGWALCSGKDDAERLATKENAVKQAYEFCAKISETLKPVLEGIASGSEDAAIMGLEIIKRWLSEHKSIVAQNRDYSVLVGVEGPTGAGKSAFLSSLLRIEKLLPSGHEGAATAVPAKVSWNYDNTPGREYRAEIIFQTKEDIQKDLCLLLTEMYHFREIINSKAYEDEDRRIQDLAVARTLIEHELPKVRAVWGLTEDMLRKHAKGCSSPQATEPKIKRILNTNLDALAFINEGTRYLNSSQPEQLSQAIKPFLDSTKQKHGRGKPFAAWPLVKTVNLFVRAEILKTGISLVDLPGCGDAVDSRAEIAKKFRERLDVRMIVSPVCRAADEKEGKTLMKNGYQEAQMMLNGKLNSTGLCVVLSKTDDIMADAYIDGCPDLRNEPEVVQKRTLKQALLKDKSALEASHNSLQQQNQGAEGYSEVARNRENPTNQGPEIGRTTEGMKREQTIHPPENFHERTRAIESEIQHIDSWLRHRAIQTRNSHVEERIHEDFSERRAVIDIDSDLDESDDEMEDELNDEMEDEEDNKEKPKEECWLRVLPISTNAFWQVENKLQPIMGFPDIRYSGIPAVEQWLHRATLESLEKHLDALLARFHNLMTNTQSYSQEHCQGIELELTKDEVESALAETHKTCEEKLKMMFAHWSSQIQAIEPLGESSSARARFNTEATRTAARWSYKYPKDMASIEKMHWVTYQAILVRGGNPFTSKGTGVTYTWLENLATPLLAGIAKEWDEKLNRYLPSLRVRIMEEFSRIWGAYLENLVFAIQKCVPSLAPEFARVVPFLGNVESSVKHEVMRALDDLSQEASEAHPEVVSVLGDQLAPTFDEALKTRNDVQVICGKVMTRLGEELKGKKKTIPEKLEAIARQAIQHAKTQVACLLNNLLENYAPGTTIQDRKGALHRNIRKLLMEWERQWRFHLHDGTHILLKDLSIPKNLDHVPLKKEE